MTPTCQVCGLPETDYKHGKLDCIPALKQRIRQLEQALVGPDLALWILQQMQGRLDRAETAKSSAYPELYAKTQECDELRVALDRAEKVVEAAIAFEKRIPIDRTYDASQDFIAALAAHEAARTAPETGERNG